MSIDGSGTDGLACHANGQVTVSGPLLRWERELDRLFLAWAAACGAVEYRFPPVVDATVLDRVDYFRSFPHLATFPVSLARDDASLRRFADSMPVRTDGSVHLDAVEPTREVLTPAACYPIYAHYRGARLAAPAYLTTRATCFRREASVQPLARQWAFDMREIVCLGQRDEASAFLARMRGQVDRLTRALDLPLQWQDATDSFFDPCSPKRILQRLAPAKQELVFAGTLAIGSVNFHRSYFGEAFDIMSGGHPAFSACIAFGLERWLFAFRERFGARPDDWPDLEPWYGR